MNGKKAQIGVEALIAIGVIFFLFLGMYALYETKKGDLLRAEEELKEREECLNIATLATTIFVLGENAEITTRINSPITVQPSAQRIEMEHSFCTLAIGHISNNASSENFILYPGTVQIKNKNGELVIENV